MRLEAPLIRNDLPKRAMSGQLGIADSTQKLMANLLPSRQPDPPFRRGTLALAGAQCNRGAAGVRVILNTNGRVRNLETVPGNECDSGNGPRSCSKLGNTSLDDPLEARRPSKAAQVCTILPVQHRTRVAHGQADFEGIARPARVTQ